jgi:hypothetical protein
MMHPRELLNSEYNGALAEVLPVSVWEIQSPSPRPSPALARKSGGGRIVGSTAASRTRFESPHATRFPSRQGSAHSVSRVSRDPREAYHAFQKLLEKLCRLVFGRSNPPHPGPLPKGEGERPATRRQIQHARKPSRQASPQATETSALCLSGFQRATTSASYFPEALARSRSFRVWEVQSPSPRPSPAVARTSGGWRIVGSTAASRACFESPYARRLPSRQGSAHSVSRVSRDPREAYHAFQKLLEKLCWLVFGRSNSPHPGPLPKGEGERPATWRQIERALKVWTPNSEFLIPPHPPNTRGIWHETRIRGKTADNSPSPLGEGWGEGKPGVRMLQSFDFCKRLPTLPNPLMSISFGLPQSYTNRQRLAPPCALCSDLSRNVRLS